MEWNYSRIRALREDKDMSQKEIAEHLHVSQATYSRYECGKLDIPTQILAQLAMLHKVSIDYLLGLDKISMRYEKEKPTKR